MAFRVGGIQSQLWFNTGVDGAVTINTSQTLNDDINAKNLILDGSTPITINSGGYRIFVQDTLTIRGTVNFFRNGGNGGNATGSPGTAGVGPVGITLGSGGNGGLGGTATGNGADGAGWSNAYGGDGGNGGAFSPLFGGSEGFASRNVFIGNALNSWIMMSGGSILTPDGFTRLDAGAGGGGGSGGNTSGMFGGGGGGGGGTIFIAASKIVFEDHCRFNIHANGGNGGNGTAGTAGCGGGPGGGGVIVLCYGELGIGNDIELHCQCHPGAVGVSTGGGANGLIGVAGAILRISETEFHTDFTDFDLLN